MIFIIILISNMIMTKRCFDATRLTVCHPVRPQNAFLPNFADNCNIAMIVIRIVMMMAVMMFSDSD